MRVKNVEKYEMLLPLKTNDTQACPTCVKHRNAEKLVRRNYQIFTVRHVLTKCDLSYVLVRHALPS